MFVVIRKSQTLTTPIPREPLSFQNNLINDQLFPSDFYYRQFPYPTAIQYRQFYFTIPDQDDENWHHPQGLLMAFCNLAALAAHLSLVVPAVAIKLFGAYQFCRFQSLF